MFKENFSELDLLNDFDAKLQAFDKKEANLKQQYKDDSFKLINCACEIFEELGLSVQAKQLTSLMSKIALDESSDDDASHAEDVFMDEVTTPELSAKELAVIAKRMAQFTPKEKLKDSLKPNILHISVLADLLEREPTEYELKTFENLFELSAKNVLNSMLNNFNLED